MTRTHTLITGLVAGLALAVAAATYAQPFGGMGHGYGPAWAWDPATARWPGRSCGNG
jgi:hypothetical protein